MKKSPVLPWLAHAMRFAGCCLICGSAVAFIAMNQGARLQDAQFFYWQRYFVDGVVSVATLPGIWLFCAGSLLCWLCQRTKKTLLLAVMALLVVINSQCFIIPLSKQASMLAFQTSRAEPVAAAFMTAKTGEDRLGAVNGGLLLGYLAIYLLWRDKAKTGLSSTP